MIFNERITAKFVKLVDNDKMVGEVSIHEALRQARNQGLDLVIVSPGDVPICRILDGDHYRFERKKAEREAAKRQRELTVETKEIRLRPVTTENDLSIKAKKAKSFLDDGDKVKVTLKLRGRERSHKENGYETLNKFLSFVGEHKVEKPVFEGEGDILTIIGPMVSKAEIHKTKKDQKDVG